MNKGRYQDYLIHPAFISFVLWLVVILFIPQLFLKYRIKHVADEYSMVNISYYYYDLDSDGISEKVSFDFNDAERTKIIVSRENKVLDQYNLKYQPPVNSPIYTDDYNRDGYLECYVFTMNDDSIFLNIIDPVRSRKIILTGRFIDLRRKAQFSADAPDTNPVGMTEGLNKKNNDLIFFINTGYSKQPRNVYRYLIEEDSLIKSPVSGAVISGCKKWDINNDSMPELILDVQATGNHDENFPFTDQYSWLMVLDNSLKFLFPPVKLSENPSRSKVLALNLKSGSLFVLFNDYFGSENIHSSFSLFDANGNKLDEKIIEDFEHTKSRIFSNEYNNCQTFYFLKNCNTEIVELDSSFNEINTLTIPVIETGDPIGVLDADNDGRKEYIFKGVDRRSLVFTQSNFKYPVSWQLTRYNIESPIVSQVFKAGSKPMLYLQFNDYGSYIRFERNPFFILKYPFYAALYLAILFFIIIIARIQHYRLSKKQQTEKKMASLQMKAIKNQLDPHFTLNIINAIGSLYATERNREKADYIFGKYALLIRQTVVSSDQIIVTLGEELDFVKNYIELEQFRSNNSFDYTIDIAEEADRQIKIPRMLIHTFVENAIKYGIRNRTEGGFLKIAVLKTDNKCEIIIEDNGPGLQSDEKSPSGTRKGLAILNELIELYSKLEKSGITYTIQNIPGSGNAIAGTAVKINIPV